MFFNTPDRLNYFSILQNHTSATIFQYSECGYPIPELPISIVQYLWAVPLRKCFSTLRAQNTCKTLAEATTIFQYLNLRNTCIILAEATSIFQYSDLENTCIILAEDHKCFSILRHHNTHIILADDHKYVSILRLHHTPICFC